jgi:hypothetical protein
MWIFLFGFVEWPDILRRRGLGWGESKAAQAAGGKGVKA